MGIHGLSKVIGDNAPKSIKENEMKNYFGRKIAIDASMSMYQFLIAIRPDSLMDDAGETTSHLQGMFHRTIRMISNGIKPVFVFDGSPPELKSAELEKRRDKREQAEEEMKKAEEHGNMEDVTTWKKRGVKVTQKHNDECKKLLRLMGVPVIEAPGEAEAQCAALVKAHLVFATGTEDMDALPFGSPILLRHLTFSEAKKMSIREFHLETVLEQLHLTMDQFIDLCILLGCDYTSSIKGIGPVRGLELIRKHGSMEGILKNIDHTKYSVPENWNYASARKLFKEPIVTDPHTIELKWTAPNEQELRKFLVEEKGFNEERVNTGIDKLKKSKTVATQSRLTNYFGKRQREEESN